MADKLSQAYLFVCEDLITNNEFLNYIANLLVCENKNNCGVCASCKKAMAKSHPDILVYPKGKNFQVSDAGEIYDNVMVKPMIASKKIFVINGIDGATEQAQNKMLKILEEPPQNVIFLLSATNENKVLRTIVSRVQKIYINKIDKNLLKNILSANSDIVEIALSNGDGYIGKTINITTNNEFIKTYNNVANLLKNLKNSTQIPAFSKFFSENRVIFENSLIILNDFFRDLLMFKLMQNQIIKNQNLLGLFEEVANEYSENALVQILKLMNCYKEKLDRNVNLVALSDGLLLEILEVKYLCK